MVCTQETTSVATDDKQDLKQDLKHEIGHSSKKKTEDLKKMSINQII